MGRIIRHNPVSSYITLSCDFADDGACASANEPAPIDKIFDPWRACIAAVDLAKRGAPDALRTCLLAAYVRVSQPFLGGEDLEHMAEILGQILDSIGDDAFARALAKQRPEVRSAVRWFIGENRKLKNSPKTAKLLRDAPKIDWPLSKAYRDDR
jgi:hypothetical protein